MPVTNDGKRHAGDLGDQLVPSADPPSIGRGRAGLRTPSDALFCEESVAAWEKPSAPAARTRSSRTSCGWRHTRPG
ncbi:hypothetical protein [Nonomuraea sp. NPDC003804]|uniref:hypothetical protein n=1 Tax=Nonomuraea sp. NPDC003804 TaxID=3154547 RepID=UPI0033BD1208